jgi:hypothetical protein
MRGEMELAIALRSEVQVRLRAGLLGPPRHVIRMCQGGLNAWLRLHGLGKVVVVGKFGDFGERCGESRISCRVESPLLQIFSVLLVLVRFLRTRP